MGKIKLVGFVAAVGLVVGVVYLAQDSSEGRRTLMKSTSQDSADNELNEASSKTASDQMANPEIGASIAGARNNVTSLAAVDRRSAPSDPRLVALMVSQDNGNIEFVVEPNGKVIKEIDKNPSNHSFKKPLREYTYSGSNVTGLIAYQYLPDYIQITETKVSYKPDGSVDQYRESTRYVYPEKKKRQ